MTKSAAPVGHATPATRVSLVNQLGSAVGISSQLLDGELECAARVALVEVIRQVAARNGLPAWPDPRSLSRDQLRPAAVQYGRPAPIRIWPLFTEAARPTTMLYVLSMPRRQRSRETKRQYFPPCGTMVAPSIAFDGWLRSRIRRGRQILPSFATTVGAFPRPELSGWPRLTSADVG